MWDFPEKWNALSQPHVRAELMAYLATAAQDLSRVELEFLVHFIFDDHDFDRTAELAGVVLIDTDEVEAVQLFVHTLHVAIRPSKQPLSATSGHSLKFVSDAAKRVLGTPAKNGVATFHEKPSAR